MINVFLKQNYKKIMNYDTYLFSRLLVDNGTKVNGVVFESLPYDEQYYILERLFNLFKISKENSLERSAYSCINDFLDNNPNLILK